MLFILVKNNLKLMLRDKLSILLLIFFPILLIAILSSAFTSLLNKNHTMEPFTVGYSIEKGSKIENNFNNFIDNFKANNITLMEMKKNKAIENVKNDTIAAYVEINDSSYKLYKKDGLSVNTIIFENSFSSAMDIYDGSKALMSYLSEYGLASKYNSPNAVSSNNFVKFENIKADPVPSSTVYYGIVEIVYIIWFGMMAVSSVVSMERKYGVTERIGLTKANSLILFLGKLIPAVIAVSIQISIAAITSAILMKVNWGNSPMLSAAIILLEIIAVSALGIFLAAIIKSQALVNVLIVIQAFFFGFIGGSCQTYMYNFVSDNIAKLSPLYYINRTLVELSTKGYSSYTNKCILLLAAISFAAIVSGILITIKERRAV